MVNEEFMRLNSQVQSFAERLRAALRKRGQSQQWLAEETGLSPAHVCRLLNGSRKPSISALSILAQVLWCETGDLWRIGE